MSEDNRCMSYSIDETYSLTMLRKCLNVMVLRCETITLLHITRILIGKYKTSFYVNWAKNYYIFQDALNAEGEGANSICYISGRVDPKYCTRQLLKKKS